MWLPLMLLALMATGSACPDLCECHPSGAAETDLPALLRVKCRGRVPALAELPANTGSLTVDGAEDYEVIGLLDELEATDSSRDLGMTDASNGVDGNDTYTAAEDNNSSLPCLDQLSATNCSLVYLNVSWRGLERIRSLNLSRNSLARLADAILVARTTNMTGLARLDLSDNSIAELSAGAFRTLTGLVWLSLRRNAINVVHEDAFRALDRLELLDLSDNRLTKLPDNALTPLYSLQKLDLSGNQLQVLGTRWFENLYRLRELDVSRNGLARATSGTLQPLSGLSVLKLSENPLKERDVSLLLGTGRRLETVDASRTGLARVPAALTRSVRALRLAGNKLTAIRGGDLDSYPLLRILDISENRLTDIEDDALGRLEVLEELDISGNVLVRVPRSLPNSLTNLKLQRNAIVALKLNDLQGLCNLRSLTLNENEIGEIEVGALGQLPVLEELDLSHNPIKTLPANTLSGPSNLAKLRMSGLTSLEWRQEEQSDMAFPVPTPERLVYLDVSGSPALARQLLADDAALSACKSLAELNLSETNITRLRFDLPYMLPQLRLLDLAGNNWDCTEELYWLGEWLMQHKQPDKDVEPGQCATPQEWSGSFLYELPSPPSPLPTVVPTTETTDSVTSSIPTTTTRASSGDKQKPSSNVTRANVPDPADNLTNTTEDSKTRPTPYHKSFSDDPTNGAEETRTASLPVAGNETRFYEAPTSFRNATSIAKTQKWRSLGRKIIKVNQTAAEMKNFITDVDGLSDRETERPSIDAKPDDFDSRTLDNRVDAKKMKTKRLNKLPMTSGKSGSFIMSKLSPRKRMDQDEGGTDGKYSKRLNDLVKEDLVLGNTVETSAMDEELNSRATNSDARVSEALSAGAHPGMLVLAGAVLGAAAALTVVLSRRATLRRRDRYHRHENIEVHTLTPTTELW
nr:platelet glycoprotein V [Nomia melanderi]XP_031834413.1 platelet glycoprotein V [Nomia melanderi]